MELTDHPGNAARYHPENASVRPDSPLRGRTILFLGSSVTEGAAALGRSFVDDLRAIDGINAVKEAVSGTTLVTEGDADGTSYIPRMKTISPALRADCFVCQLSTNDATQGRRLGALSDGFDPAGFDTATVAGAMEYIVAYARAVWRCPVVFYTGTRFDCPAYGGMVELLHRLAAKWSVGVIDLWNDPDMQRVDEGDYQLYMADGVHPTQAGYLLWWTPKIEQYLERFLA